MVAGLILSFALLGFGAGWVLTQQPLYEGLASDDVTEREDRTREKPVEISFPEGNVEGKDISGLPRYPGSVRVRYGEAVIGDLSVTRAGYVADAELDEARDFYRDTFRNEGWAVADVSYSKGEWTFFVTRQEREAILEIEEQSSLVEVEIELSEPREATPEPDDADDYGDDVEGGDDG